MKESRFLERSVRTCFLKTEQFSLEQFTINREITELINFNHTTLYYTTVQKIPITLLGTCVYYLHEGKISRA
jgi:hypothetical protein